jgi:hypothetical protein
MIIKEAPASLVRSVLAWCPDVEGMTGAIIAGGFIRAYYAGEFPNDMDIYFEEEKYLTSACKLLEESGWEKIGETDRAMTFRQNDKRVQCIGVIYGKPEEIINAFDFTVCSAALTMGWSGEGFKATVYLHNNFMEHLAGRVLVFTGSPLPLASLKRAFKYHSRGYHICDENLINIATAISSAVDFSKEESVAEHIAGMDPDGGRRVRVID